MAFTSTQMGGAYSALSAFSSYITAGKQARQDQKWQDYNNKMTRISDGLNQSIITINDLMRKDRKLNQLQQIDASERATSASAEVSAAATGTTGNSVNMVLLDIGRNADNARAAIERDDELQDVQSANQRLQSSFSAEMQIDRRQIQGPSTASLLLGLGTGVAKMI